MPVPYKTRAGKEQFMPTLEEANIMEDDDEGFCLACCNTQQAEPDAAKYTCDTCGLPKVYGIAELVLMDLIA